MADQVQDHPEKAQEQPHAEEGKDDLPHDGGDLEGTAPPRAQELLEGDGAAAVDGVLRLLGLPVYLYLDVLQGDGDEIGAQHAHGHQSPRQQHHGQEAGPAHPQMRRAGSPAMPWLSTR